MPDYSKTIIYKIVCRNESVDYLYVGSSTNFKKRKNNHKNSCNNINSKAYNQKTYKLMREHGGWDNFIAIEIEKYPCNNNKEKKAREEEIRLELKANINSIRCHRSDEQKEEYNKEYNKEYRDLNKVNLKEYRKEYRVLNREKLNERVKAYRYLNKEKLYEKAKLKFECSCGSIFNVSDKARHLKSTKHQNYINNL